MMTTTYNGPKPRPGRRPDPRRYAFPDVLRQCGGNLTAAARRLGITRQTAGRWYRAMKAGTLIPADPTTPTPERSA